MDARPVGNGAAIIRWQLQNDHRFLTSPIVEFVIGEGENETVLTAHQDLLLESPVLKQLIDAFDDSSPRRIELPSEDVKTFSCFLEYQYTHNYSSHFKSNDSLDSTDESSKLLIHHAEVYTLAKKLGLMKLERLAHKKIHKVESTPMGELRYARYIYTHTNAGDVTIRRPIVSYWATQGHILRRDLEDEFRLLCIELPDFSHDVISLMWDRQEKGKSPANENDSSEPGSARERHRQEE